MTSESEPEALAESILVTVVSMSLTEIDRAPCLLRYGCFGEHLGQCGFLLSESGVDVLQVLLFFLSLLPFMGYRNLGYFGLVSQVGEYDCR